MNLLDFQLLVDPGVSTLKVLLYRNGGVLAHFVTSSCEEILKETYDRESQTTYAWGCGVVQFPTQTGEIKYYRVGVNPIADISPAFYKWDVTAVKIVCILGWLSQSSSSPLEGALTVLLPIDEDVDRGPLSRAIREAILNNALVNGKPVKIILSKIRIPFEGSGFCMSDRMNGGIFAGHCDIAFAAGMGGAVDKRIGFTLSGSGAVLPINLAGLNQKHLGELQSAIEFQKALKSCNFKGSRKSTMGRSDWMEIISTGKWDKFLTRGLILEDIWEAATTGIIDYFKICGKDFYRIGTLCAQHRIDPLSIGGGSGQMIGLLFGPILKEFVKIQGTREIEDAIAASFPSLSSDRIACKKLVDLYQVASGIEEFQYFFEHGQTPPTLKFSEEINV